MSNMSENIKSGASQGARSKTIENRLQRREFTFDRVIRIFFTVCLLAGAIFLIAILKDVLLPFL